MSLVSSMGRRASVEGPAGAEQAAETAATTTEAKRAARTPTLRIDRDAIGGAVPAGRVRLAVSAIGRNTPGGHQGNAQHNGGERGRGKRRLCDNYAAAGRTPADIDSRGVPPRVRARLA